MQWKVVLVLVQKLKKYIHEKGYIWNPAKFTCENGKYLASIMDE